MVKSLVDD
jgi:hypothetical protein